MIPEYAITLEANNFYIHHSFKYKKLSEMRAILRDCKQIYPERLVNRTVFSMVNEWRVHNLLYSLGIARKKTYEVNFEYKQPWYISIIYTILSPFYLHFK